ncbi:MAG: hypothetical protein AAB834_01975, partial [Patescibacteria group bacterium]
RENRGNSPDVTKPNADTAVMLLPRPVAVALDGTGAEVATLAGDGDAVEQAWRLAAGGFVTQFR